MKPSDPNILDFHLGHFQELERLLDSEGGVKLIVIDPAGAYVGRSGVNENRDANLRALLGPMSEVANRTGATVLLIKHLNKSAGISAVKRVSGSVGYVNASRFSYIIAPDPADADRKLMVVIKHNLGIAADGLAFRIVPIPPKEARAMLMEKWGDLDSDLEELSKQLIRQTWESGVMINPNDLADGTHRPVARRGHREVH